MISQVVEPLQAINVSSKRVVDIIAVIDGIAFQTDILALNAAVEAVRGRRGWPCLPNAMYDADTDGRRFRPENGP